MNDYKCTLVLFYLNEIKRPEDVLVLRALVTSPCWWLYSTKAHRVNSLHCLLYPVRITADHCYPLCKLEWLRAYWVYCKEPLTKTKITYSSRRYYYFLVLTPFMTGILIIKRNVATFFKIFLLVLNIRLFYHYDLIYFSEVLHYFVSDSDTKIQHIGWTRTSVFHKIVGNDLQLKLQIELPNLTKISKSLLWILYFKPIISYTPRDSFVIKEKL